VAALGKRKFQIITPAVEFLFISSAKTSRNAIFVLPKPTSTQKSKIIKRDKPTNFNASEELPIF
jgi:hypothetical protein